QGCAVLVKFTVEEGDMKKILVAHDGSKPSEKAMRRAFEIAGKFGSSVTIVSVIPDFYLADIMETDRARIVRTLTDDAKKMLERIKSRHQGSHPLKTVLKKGNPAEVVIEEARKMKASLIITGSHGRHGAQKFLLGSVSSKIVDHADCSVLVVK
ncbi:MAG: universal stress protein, partial [Candidatus Sulfobium sp.]